MKRLVLVFALVFIAALAVSPAVLAKEYNLVNLKKDLGDISVTSGWKYCGEYFTSANSTEGELIYFKFEVMKIGDSTEIFSFVFLKRGDVEVVVNESKTPPTVTLIEKNNKKQFRIKIRLREYLDSQCLKEGTGV